MDINDVPPMTDAEIQAAIEAARERMAKPLTLAEAIDLNHRDEERKLRRLVRVGLEEIEDYLSWQ